MEKERIGPGKARRCVKGSDVFEGKTSWGKLLPVSHGHHRGSEVLYGRRIGVRLFRVTFLIVMALCLIPICEASALRDEAGFMEIEPVKFSFQKKGFWMDLTSSRARLWYVFQTADEDAIGKPLFVFFNGGPGCATSDALLSYNTARMTVDSKLNGGKEIGPNPVSWTRLGNLLYVDARETGFSYNLMAKPQSKKAREAQFDAQNCDPFIDGADFVRLILRFLSDHPEIRSNRVVIVGESYGGIRSTVILHLLLNYSEYATGGQVYQDKSLVKEIQAHYNAVFPDFRDQVVPPGVIVGQFGRQILIEPVVSFAHQMKVSGQMYEKKGSIIYRIARETGKTYTPCSRQKGACNPYSNAIAFVNSSALRDIYDYAKPRDWLMELFVAAERKLNYADNLSELIGTDVVSVKDMYAVNRRNAYRTIDAASAEGLAGESLWGLQTQKNAGVPLAEQLRRESMARSHAKAVAASGAAAGDLTEVFGALKKWDRYFMDTNEDALDSFYENKAVTMGYRVSPEASRYGVMFLENVVHAKTFITNAGRDLVVYSAATPKALALHTGILSSVTHDTKVRSGVARPGWMVLKYRKGAVRGMLGQRQRTIRFPIYAESCHSVSVTQPRDLFADVTEWLKED